MDVTQPENLTILVNQLKEKFKDNDLVNINQMGVNEPYKQLRDNAYAGTYVYRIDGDAWLWCVDRVHKCLQISPGKEYHMHIQKFVIKNGQLYVKIADALLEKQVEAKPRKRKVAEGRSKKAPSRRSPYDHFFED